MRRTAHQCPQALHHARAAHARRSLRSFVVFGEVLGLEKPQSLRLRTYLACISAYLRNNNLDYSDVDTEVVSTFRMPNSNLAA